MSSLCDRICNDIRDLEAILKKYPTIQDAMPEIIENGLEYLLDEKNKG